jgi:hypothetical protein
MVKSMDIKSHFNNLRITDWKKDTKEPVKLLWESLVNTLSEVFENQRKNQFTTRVPINGKIFSVDTPFWPGGYGIYSATHS